MGETDRNELKQQDHHSSPVRKILPPSTPRHLGHLATAVGLSLVGSFAWQLTPDESAN